MAADIEIVVGAQDKATQVIDQVVARVSSFGGILDKVGSLGAAASGGIMAVQAALNMASAAMGFFIGNAMEAGDAIDVIYDKARGLGVATGDLQAFQFAMKEAGNVSGEQSIAALQKMQRIIGEVAGGGNKKANDVFSQLKIDAKELSLQRPIDQFMKVKEALSGVENVSERAALAQSILGKSAADLIPALITEKESFEASMQAASDLGLAVSDEGAAGVAAMNDALDRVSAGFTGIWNQVIVDLAPAVTGIATELATWLPSVIKLAQEYFPLIVDSTAILLGNLIDIAKLSYQTSTFDVKGAFETANAFFEGKDTGTKYLESINEQRQATIDAAKEKEQLAKASADAARESEENARIEIEAANKIRDAELEIAEAIKKQATERERAIANGDKIIENLKRQIEVMQLGETNVKENENLASAANEQQREEIDALQKKLGQLREQEEAAKLAEVERKRAEDEKKKREQERLEAEDKQKKFQSEELAPTSLQATQSRLLTRGSSDQDRMATIASNTKTANDLAKERNRLARQQLAKQGSENLKIELVK